MYQLESDVVSASCAISASSTDPFQWDLYLHILLILLALILPTVKLTQFTNHKWVMPFSLVLKLQTQGDKDKRRILGCTIYQVENAEDEHEPLHNMWTIVIDFANQQESPVRSTLSEAMPPVPVPSKSSLPRWGLNFVYKICLEELVSPLVSKENQDRVGVLECVLSFCLGKY